MSDLTIIVPSRNRPESAYELLDAFARTCRGETDVLFAVDVADTTLRQYPDEYVIAVPEPRQRERTMVYALNYTAHLVSRLPHAARAIGFMGDDHRPVSVGWDTEYIATLDALTARRGCGMVYGDDLYQGRNLPTQIAMTTNIVTTLGHMVHPELRHMYADNYWRAIGTAANVIKYLPDVVVEHLHPVAGKSTMDPDYARVADYMTPDANTYRRLMASGVIAADAAKLCSLG